MSMRTWRASAAVGTIASACFFTAPAGAGAPDLDALAETIEAARAAWDVPGLAVGVVRDGELVFARGFGVRELGSDDAVDAETLFAIGSATKSFTAACMAVLVDEGKFKWNDRVIDHLPWFRMHDAYATREMRISDLLSHRSGLERGDMLWYGTDLDRKEIVRRVRHLEPATSFRAAFGYQNIMYIAAGEVIHEVAGQDWDEFVTKRILRPLGMMDSNTSVTRLSGLSNVATPHAEIDDEIVPVSYRNIDNVGPAGSINSNVIDMGQWVKMQLARGAWGEPEEEGGEQPRLLEKASVENMWAARTIIGGAGASAAESKSNFTMYALGWMTQDYRGRRIVHHGGNIDGMSALVSLMPDEGVGLVVLSNMNGSGVTGVVANQVYDAFLGYDDTDWSETLLKVVTPMREAAKNAVKQAQEKRIEGTTHALPLADYAGTYTHEMYGDIVIELNADALVLRRGSIVADMEHWHYETFRADGREPLLGKSPVTFHYNSEGKIAGVTALGIDDWDRKPEPPKADDSIELTRDDMARYAGEYAHDSMPLSVTVRVTDEGLRVAIPGQPPYPMIPTGEHRFALGGLPAQLTVDLVFEFDGEGVATKLTLTQEPGGVFELKPTR